MTKYPISISQITAYRPDAKGDLAAKLRPENIGIQNLAVFALRYPRLRGLQCRFQMGYTELLSGWSFFTIAMGKLFIFVL